MADVYTNAYSYQVSITTTQSGKTPDGKAFTVTQSEHIQYQSPNIFHKSVDLSGTGAAATGQGAQQLALRQGEIYSDGKTATMYVPSRKMYQKQPVPPTVTIVQLVDLLRLVPPINQPGLILLSNNAIVQGRQAYIVEVRPVMPPNPKPEAVKKYQEGLKQFKQFPRFIIDKQNYSLLEYSLSKASGNAQVSLSSQVFGGTIPLDLFVFTPPLGARLYAPSAEAADAQKPGISLGDLEQGGAPISQPIRAPVAIDLPLVTLAPIYESTVGAVERIRSQPYSPLAAPTAMPASSGQQEGMRIQNQTQYTLTLHFVGPISKTVSLFAGLSTDINLPPGTYEVAGEVSSKSVRPFYGRQSYNADTRYQQTFYIGTR